MEFPGEQNKIQIPIDEIPLGNINRYKNNQSFIGTNKFDDNKTTEEQHKNLL